MQELDDEATKSGDGCDKKKTNEEAGRGCPRRDKETSAVTTLCKKTNTGNKTNSSQKNLQKTVHEEDDALLFKKISHKRRNEDSDEEILNVKHCESADYIVLKRKYKKVLSELVKEKQKNEDLQKALCTRVLQADDWIQGILTNKKTKMSAGVAMDNITMPVEQFLNASLGDVVSVIEFEEQPSSYNETNNVNYIANISNIMEEHQDDQAADDNPKDYSEGINNNMQEQQPSDCYQASSADGSNNDCSGNAPDTINLGEGISISAKKLKDLKSMSDSMFVKDFAKHTWGDDMLANRSLTGRVCNATKKKMTSATEGKPKLTPDKVDVIRKQFVVKLNEEGITGEAQSKRLKNFNKFLGEKMQTCAKAQKLIQETAASSVPEPAAVGQTTVEVTSENAAPENL